LEDSLRTCHQTRLRDDDDDDDDDDVRRKGQILSRTKLLRSKRFTVVDLSNSISEFTTRTKDVSRHFISVLTVPCGQ